MSITKDDVKYIAHLARLTLTDKEIAYFAGQLNKIIGYIDQLKEVNTSNVESTSHPMPISNVFRKDIVRPSLGADSVLKNAPEKEDGLFKVPKIIEER